MEFDPAAVLNFWFEESTPKNWFTKDKDYDKQIKERFGVVIDTVANIDKENLLATPETALAAVIILDQFTRNVYRDDAKSFAYDAKALEMAKMAVARELDKELPETKRHFLYMPFMHSEDKAVHEQAVELFGSLTNQEALEFELKHKRIIDRFGRYPHRNEILGRESTKEEIDFLENEKDSSF